MSTAVENALYHLVIDRRPTDVVFVFLGTDPAPDHASEPVLLDLLPPGQRFGGGEGVAMGRPVLGRWPGGLIRFRQFLTLSELEQGGWVPVSQYRVCDCWADYFTPWSRRPDDEPTMLAATAHGRSDQAETVRA